MAELKMNDQPKKDQSVVRFSSFLKDFRESHALVYFLFGLAILVFAIYVFEVPNSEGIITGKDFVFWKSFPKELAFALIIAAVVAVTIERAARQKQRDEVNEQINQVKKNLFKAVYGETISNLYFEYFEKTVLKSSVFRSNLQLAVVMNKVRENDELIKLNITTRWTINNTSDVPYNYGYVYFVDEGDPMISKINLLSTGGNALTAEELENVNANLSIKTTEPYRKFFKEYVIPARGKLDFISEIDVFKTKNDHMLWQTLHPSDGIVYSVVGLPGLKIYDDLIHSSSSENIGSENEPKSIIRRFNGPMYPGNGFIFWWRKTDTV
jgi:hypothetical protein